MVKTGILRIDTNTGVSRLDAGPNDKKRLAKDGAGDPFGPATDFLVNERSLNDGDFIFVVGTEGPASGVAAIFITDAGLASDAKRVLTSKTAKKARTRSTKSSKKAGTKKTTKKRSGKKSNKNRGR